MTIHGRARKAGLWMLVGALVVVAAAGAPFLLKQNPPANAQASSPALGALAQLQDGFTAVAEAVEPAVVSISAERTSRTASLDLPDIFRNWPFGDLPFGAPRATPRTQTVGGSGVIVRSDGYILTNDHVVGGAENVTVTLFDGREFPGKVMRDYATDLAVVKIEADNLPTAKLGDSSKVRPGAWAIAIGSPLGFSNTLTVGVVSALEREMSIPDSEGPGRYYASLIQTDASINPGNSGGPLLNLQGEVIGINVAIASPTGGNIGLGFAIPSNTAKFVLEQLVKHGKVNRGFLGVVPVDVRPAMAKSYGVEKGALIRSVTDGTPAAEAGIRVEDVIVEFDGKPIESGLALRDAVARTAPGSKVKVVVVRGGQRKTLEVTVGSPPTTLPGNEETPRTEELGISVSPLNNNTRSEYGIGQDVRGVVVTSVTPGSNAARAGISRGDVIQRVNGVATNTVADFNRAVRGLKSGDTARIVIRRGDAQSLVEVRIP
jgi:serine protease Do